MSVWDALQGQVFNDPDSGVAPGTRLVNGQWVAPDLNKKGDKYFRPLGGSIEELREKPAYAPLVDQFVQSGDVMQDDSGQWFMSTDAQDKFSDVAGIKDHGWLDGLLTKGPLILGSAIMGGALAGAFPGVNAAGVSIPAGQSGILSQLTGGSSLSGGGGVSELAGQAAGDMLTGAPADAIEYIDQAIRQTGATTATEAAQALGYSSTTAMLQAVNPAWVTAGASAVGAGSTLSRLVSGNGSGGDYANAASLLAGPLASIGAGAYAANAAKDAAQAGVDATGQSIAEQRRQYDITRADNAPFQQTGVAANTRLKQLSGLDPSYTGADSGYLTRPFTDADMQADPVYKSGLQFGLDEGTKAVNARAIGAGGYDSGATLKALTRYGNDYASTKGNEAFNRFETGRGNIYNKLAGVSGAGQTAVNTVANAGTNATNAISNDLTGAGNARAAGIVGGANAWGSAAQGVNNSINQYQSNETLKALLARNNGTSIYGY